MASSSSFNGSSPASVTQSWKHDVYISFRGPDTRRTFVDHLYTALRQSGIITYVDRETLPVGVPMGPALLRAIEVSRIAIVVFSQNYADSSWCLDDVACMMECSRRRGQIIIPIFYHINPSHVRKQKGTYGKSFLRHEEKNNHKIGSWREALEYASNFRGFVINLNSRESICIKKVVNTVTNKLLPIREITPIGTCLKDPEHGGSGNHDVYINFQEDTRNNFVDHLLLTEQGIHTYMEEESFPMDEAESIDLTHLTAIKDSRLIMIIFSKNYANSSRCLDELSYIMECMHECGQIVIPIFYHVDAPEVRRQHGSFFKAFSEYESANNKRVRLWRKTLAEASNIFGWDINLIANGHEAKGLKVIVEKVSKTLFPDKDLVGLQTRLDFMKYGGGGMTTFASSSHDDVEHLRISLQDILRATNNFSVKNVIAGGGFGRVYQGKSEKHGTIAVKQWDRNNRAGQGDHEFMMEIALLSAYKHENLVSLVGFCDQDDQKILVYKFESNGSLDKHLHSKDLTWIQRLQICLDAANGLKYLHDDVGPQHRILHRDIKSSNILLDEKWKAKISDFGLSKIALANVPCSVIISGACGTMGYVDPQYREHNILTQKSDVYSFGVVLFEVLCGRLVNVRQYQDERHFSAKLAQNCYENDTLDDIIDSDLQNQMNSDSLITFSTIAYQCLKKRREERPTMSVVVDQLMKALDYQQGSSGFWHDVYISFRQRDAESHIVNDIYAALHQEGVSTYTDDVTNSRQESILVKAIERSRLFVIIFTKKFAINSWYLDEVAKIIECMKEKGQFVLPVFYNVSRSDVRTQKGYFGEVISEYDTHPKMEIWRNALVEATNAVGLEYSTFRSSADLVKKIIEEIKNGLAYTQQ